MRTVLVALIVGIASMAQAQVTTLKLEARSVWMTGSNRPSVGVNLYTATTFAPKFGVAAWLQVEEGWAEAYVGPTFAPADWVELGLSLGVEQAKMPLRVAGSLWLGSGRYASLTIVETGGSGLWIKSVNTIAVVDWLKLGLVAARFNGVGPRVEFKFDRVTLWVNGFLFDPEASAQWMRGAQAGISVSML